MRREDEKCFQDPELYEEDLFLFNGCQEEECLQACGRRGLRGQEDCVAEDGLDEITDPQVAPEAEDVFVHLLKRVQKFFFFLPGLK